MEIKIGNADSLKTSMNSYFAQLGVSVDDAFQQAIDEVGKEAVKQLKATSPRGKGSKKGHYANGWTYKRANVRKGQFEAKVYNKTKPGLTHLLENKHRKLDRNGNEHGWSDPKPHIAEVDKWVQEELPKRISQKISQK